MTNDDLTIWEQIVIAMSDEEYDSLLRYRMKKAKLKKLNQIQ